MRSGDEVRQAQQAGPKAKRQWPTWVSVVSMMLTAAMFALMIVQTITQVRRDEPEIVAFVLESLELTQFPEHPSLVGSFSFDGEPVKHLYRIRIQLMNTGNSTILGEGAHKMIVGETLPIYFPEGSTILDLNCNDPSGLTQGVSYDGGTLLVAFKQWRPQESLSLRVYVSNPLNPSDMLMPYVDEREIENGLFRVVEQCGLQDASPSPLLYRLPDTLRVLILIAAAISGLYWATVAMYHFYLGVFTHHGQGATAQQLLLFEADGIEPFGKQMRRGATLLGRRRRAWLAAVALLRIVAAVCPLLYLVAVLLP